MRSVVFVLSLLAAAACIAQEGGSPKSAPEEVRFQNGDLSLAGLWFVPPGEGPFPATVVIRGSGSSDRRSYWARSIIDVLLEEGVAVLLPDKRGSDGSAGDWRTANFDELAEDALAAVDFVRTRPEVQKDEVGLVGLSQGGKIAPVAASRSDQVAFVIDVVGASTSLIEQISWEMYHTFREEGLEGKILLEALNLQVKAEKFVKGELSWDAYRKELDSALGSSWSTVAEGFPASEDSWQWKFFRGVADFDPLPFWRKVKQPVLVVYAEDDHNAPAVRSTYLLIRAFMEENHSDWTVRIFPETGHALWDPESTDPHRPDLHPGFVALLQDWVGRRIGRPDRKATSASAE